VERGASAPAPATSRNGFAKPSIRPAPQVNIVEAHCFTRREVVAPPFSAARSTAAAGRSMIGAKWRFSRERASRR
jgi:hypothetical protein